MTSIAFRDAVPYATQEHLFGGFMVQSFSHNAKKSHEFVTSIYHEYP